MPEVKVELKMCTSGAKITGAVRQSGRTSKLSEVQPATVSVPEALGMDQSLFLLHMTRESSGENWD